MHENIEQNLVLLLRKLALDITYLFRTQPLGCFPVLGIDIPGNNCQRQVPGDFHQLRIQVPTKTASAVWRPDFCRYFPGGIFDNVLGLFKLPSHILLWRLCKVGVAPGMILYVMSLAYDHSRRIGVLFHLVAENIKLRLDFLLLQRLQDALERTHGRRRGRGRGRSD